MDRCCTCDCLWRLGFEGHTVRKVSTVKFDGSTETFELIEVIHPENSEESIIILMGGFGRLLFSNAEWL